MTAIQGKFVHFIIIFFLCAWPMTALAEYDYIKISDPFLRKIPIAIPEFKALEGKPADSRISRGAADTISKGLDYTGYFRIIDRGGFLVEPSNYEITVGKINFQNWKAIGAELLITGGYLLKGDSLIMDLRLIDTFKSKLLVGKRYQGRLQDQRRMIHRFCSDVIFHLTGNRGLFNSKIAFLSTGSGNKEIYICDFDGNYSRRFTHTNNITLSPAWSSDGKWIAYTAYAKGKPHIYIKHLTEKRGTIIARKGLNITPAWVPGQFSLAAALSFSGDSEIYLLTGTGKIIKRLTRRWGIDLSPSWSPDGQKMAFVSNRSGTPQIFIKHMASEKVERLTFQGRYNTSPSWSPKGDRIAYAAMENGQFNIYVITVDGQQLVQMTQDAGNNESPSWSPDGSLIAFSSTREGSSRIYLMTAYGTDQRRLLTLAGEQTGPAWSPSIMDN